MRYLIIAVVSIGMLSCGDALDLGGPNVPPPDDETDSDTEYHDGGGEPCIDDGVIYQDGESWQCSDGCNHCICEDGIVSSTIMECKTQF